jgi:glycosyltransferase involved in cell wall biosynthesis
MKIAVYTVALNEEQFVERWVESARDADYLLIADTGSTDRTAELAASLGVNVVSIGVKPWRFDDARNAALALIPTDIDYCISLDMDEVLVEGWRDKLEAIDPSVTRPRYNYTWSWTPSGSPGLQFGGDHIHARQGYRWKHPVHEVLVADRIKEVQGWIDLNIEHHPDSTKSRGQYLPLLELSSKEDPNDDRNAYYYARELFFYGQYEKAAVEFRRHLDLPSAKWLPERAASMRHLAKCEPENAYKWLLAATLEDPSRREAWVDLALLEYKEEDWAECLEAAATALEITEKPLDYLCEEFAWGSIPWDLAALSSHHLELKDNAIRYGKKALEIEPDNQRLASNLAWYEGK